MSVRRGVNVLRTADLEYDLPESRIATTPATPRDSARLMVVGRGGEPGPSQSLGADVLHHTIVSQLPEILRPEDLLVFNATRVLRARFTGHRDDTGGAAEGLFLGEETASTSGAARWRCLVKMKRIKPGVEVLIGREGSAGLRLVAVEPIAGEAGAWVFDVRRAEGTPVSGPAAEVLESVGLTPLPPYILRAREHSGFLGDEEEDHERYQTVYAGTGAGAAGSVAAPTAGLHFTPGLLERLRARGVEMAEVTLHVGTGTFRPVETEFVEQHPMHAEWCSMSPEAVERVRRAKREGRRVIAVGTTSARTLETYAQRLETQAFECMGFQDTEIPENLTTRILITPGYQWRWVDGMLTNFHLPRSTLMAMVGARLGKEGVERLKGLYAEALARGYRFYSYGDAMLIA
jgi:S-adenosylmethionine:tRNA ribosyltransferase-isomerase